MPQIFPGLRIERDDRGEEQIVAALGAADLGIPRRAVAGTEIDAVEIGIVGDRIPGGAAPAMLPPFAGPGLRRHCLGIVLEALRRIARHGVEAPQPLAARGIVGGDIAADGREIRAAMADDHFAAEYPRCAGDVAAIVGPFRGLHRPGELARLRVDRE